MRFDIPGSGRDRTTLQLVRDVARAIEVSARGGDGRSAARRPGED